MSSVERIMEASIHLFMAQGYKKTTARQIAAEAGLSLGLMNHHFDSKADLAAAVLRLLTQHIVKAAEPYMDIEADPLYADALLIRTLNGFLLGSRWRRFYIECFEEDVFFKTLSRSSITLIRAEMAHYGVALPEDLLSLYGRYIPYNMEKTLVLGKEQGLFPSIDYDDIPDYILSASVEKFLPAADIMRVTQAARQAAPGIIRSTPEYPAKAAMPVQDQAGGSR